MLRSPGSDRDHAIRVDSGKQCRGGYERKTAFPSLIHAEREAKRLKNQLVTTSNFDTSSKRTKLLIGATTAELGAAFEQIAHQLEQDKQLFKSMESIFLFYFTGHGLEGRLLLEDGALSSKKLAEMFKSVSADLSVGIFDACYSGSLDGMLQEKGIRSTPGLNLASDIPHDVLLAKGNIWYVSSGAGQPSYEDARLGGIFTHYFIESLEKAHQRGPGITLESIWQYVRENTISYTSKNKRTQVPEQLISNLRAKSSIYFSFPKPRNAGLVLSEQISGRFALAYTNGNFMEMFEKKPGQKKTLSVFAGDAKLIFFDDEVGNSKTEYQFNLKEGETLVIKNLPASKRRSGNRYGDDSLLEKGLVVEKHARPLFSLSTGAGYEASIAHSNTLNPIHRFGIPLKLKYQYLVLTIQPIYGFARRRFPEWGYVAHLVSAKLRGGYRMGLGTTELQIGIAVSGAYMLMKMMDEGRENTHHVWQIRPAAFSAVTLFSAKRLSLEISAEIGALFSPGINKESIHEMKAGLSGGVGVAGYFNFI